MENIIKNYVLDTNILLQDSEAMNKFAEHNVYIPYAVLDELDSIKGRKENPEAAYQARRAIKMLDEIRQSDIHQLPGGGILVFYGDYDVNDIPGFLDEKKHDHIIMATAKAIERDNKDTKTILITSDIIMSIKATELFGLNCESYRNQQVETRYTGRRELEIDHRLIAEFYDKGCLDIDKISVKEVHPNEFLLLKSALNLSSSALGYYNADKKQICSLKHLNDHMSGVKCRNVGQKFAKEALLNDIEEAPLVILQGPAGTAKTFLALAAGLQMVEEGKVRQVLLLRPQSFFDDEIGYLPGDEQQKIDPLLRPFWDNLAYIMTSSGVGFDDARDKIDEYITNEVIRAESFAYIRGRSITDTFIIVDESQNTTRRQIVGVATRAGLGSKIVLTGDIAQIDNPHIDIYNNGLSYIIDKMKDSPLTWQVTFDKEECRRSELAKDAINRLD